MPATLPPLSRRQFLAGSLIGLSAAATNELLWGDEKAVDPNRFVLFSDTHIAGDRATVARGINMTDHLCQAIQEVLQSSCLPAAVLICGDCAFSEGTAEDYTTMCALIQPLRDAGVPVHLAMGNHDHRERFLQIVEEGRRALPPVEHRHVVVIESPFANWYVLDSLDETNKTPGVLGSLQLEWLSRVLDQHRDKPALVMVHHQPDHSDEPSGLVDTKPLLDLLAAHSHVQVLYFGHTHRWQVTVSDLNRAGGSGVHQVNLPPTAYIFQEGDPCGWVDAAVLADGITLTLNCIDKKHALHGTSHSLTWK
jgi:hypothetical protein